MSLPHWGRLDLRQMKQIKHGGRERRGGESTISSLNKGWWKDTMAVIGDDAEPRKPL